MQILVITMLFSITAAGSECIPYLIQSDKTHYSTFKVSDGLAYVEYEKDDFIHWTQESPLHYDFYFKADLSWDGILEIRAHLVDYNLNLRSSLSGRVLFKNTIKFFKRRHIKMIRATWVEGSDNYRLFHEALESGKSLKEAAFMTWTGQQAKLFGFDRIHDLKILEKGSSSSGGKTLTSKVEVDFRMNRMDRFLSNLPFL